MITGLIIPGFSPLCTDGIERSSQSRDSLTPEIWGGICRSGVQIHLATVSSVLKANYGPRVLKIRRTGPLEVQNQVEGLKYAADASSLLS